MARLIKTNLRRSLGKIIRHNAQQHNRKDNVILNNGLLSTMNKIRDNLLKKQDKSIDILKSMLKDFINRPV